MKEKKYVLRAKMINGDIRYYNGTNSQVEVVRLVSDKDKAIKFNTLEDVESAVIRAKKLCNFTVVEVN